MITSPEIFALQRNYSRVQGRAETFQIMDLVEQALYLNTWRQARRSRPARRSEQVKPHVVAGTRQNHPRHPAPEESVLPTFKSETLP